MVRRREGSFCWLLGIKIELNCFLKEKKKHLSVYKWENAEINLEKCRWFLSLASTWLAINVALLFVGSTMISCVVLSLEKHDFFFYYFKSFFLNNYLFLFFFLQINNFLVFLDYFDALISKIIF